TEQQYRAELWIETAADDDLVTVQFHHWLHGHALKMLGSYLLGNRRLNITKGGFYSLGVCQVQFHTTHIGLMSDRLRVQFEHNWIANLVSRFHGIRHAGGNACLHRWDAISCQNLFGLEFRQDGAVGSASRLDDLLDNSMIRPSGIAVGERRRLINTPQ